MPYSLSVAAGDVMTGINRYHGRSLTGSVFLLGGRQLQQRLAVLGRELLVVADDPLQLIGRQHAFQIGETLGRALLDEVEHDVDALATIALDDGRGRRQATALVAL